MLKYFRIALAALSVITEAEECLKDGKITLHLLNSLCYNEGREVFSLFPVCP